MSAAPPADQQLPRSPVRLHPLSPLVRIGRALLGLLGVLAVGAVGGGSHGYSTGHVVDAVILGLALVAAVASWVVTTWHLDGDALQVSFGVLRRQTVRVPMARVQAIDLVEPWQARVLGLAEVRVRTGGGSGGDARLTYLKLEEAAQVRAALLALAHGLPGSTPPPPEWPLLMVSNRRLVASVFLTAPAILSVLAIAAFVALALTGVLGPAALGAGGGSIAVYLFGLARSVARRLAHEWGLQVAEAPDGLRIRCGLGSRVAETIPAGRIQAVRMLEPMWWRPLGWHRLELHLAGGVTRTSQPGAAAVLRRALLPVGTRADVDLLLARVAPWHGVALSRPPRRTALRAPFSYHFLAAGHSPAAAASAGGRVRRFTEWVPLAKAQSIRSVRGPLQRLLGLATVRLDVAGRRAGVAWMHRGGDEAARLMGELPAACERARSYG